ncbi:MAG: ARPP-1 family domain-containing protein [Candidatus Thorarchaeota archaeon]
MSGPSSQVLKLIENAEMTAPQVQGNLAVTGLIDEGAEFYNGIVSTQISLEMGNMNVEETGNVPSLRFFAKEPTLIRCGEGVLGGGKQDRIVAESTVVEGHMNLNVFCIEAGRWEHSHGEWLHTNTPISMRKAILQGRNQQDVWNKVQSILSEWGVRSGTSALGELYVQYGHEFERYVSRFKWSDDEIGKIVSIGGEVQGVEIFGDKMGLRRDFTSILKESYAPLALRKPEREMAHRDVNEGISSFLSELHCGRREAQVANYNGNVAYACAV